MNQYDRLIQVREERDEWRDLAQRLAHIEQARRNMPYWWLQPPALAFRGPGETESYNAFRQAVAAITDDDLAALPAAADPATEGMTE